MNDLCEEKQINFKRSIALFIRFSESFITRWGYEVKTKGVELILLGGWMILKLCFIENNDGKLLSFHVLWNLMQTCFVKIIYEVYHFPYYVDTKSNVNFFPSKFRDILRSSIQDILIM